MTNQEKISLVEQAIRDLNKCKNLDIALHKIIPIDVGIKIDISSKHLMWPISCLIANNTFDTGKEWEHDEKAGVKKLMDRPEGLNVDTCVKLRVAYIVYSAFRKFHR